MAHDVRWSLLAPGDEHKFQRRQSGLRVAPGRNGVPIAAFWRVWSQGDEVYLSRRQAEAVAKISLHSKGHWRFEVGHKRIMFAPPVQLAGGKWMYAVEIRWLVDGPTLRPFPAAPLNQTQSALVIEMPAGDSLVLSVLLGTPGTGVNEPLPENFGGARLFSRQLRNGQAMVVVGRVRPESDEDRDSIRKIRHELGFTASVSGKPAPATLELMRVSATPAGGNVVEIFPLGPENLRFSETSG